MVEGEPMTAQFRLHRFDSHLRQHAVQAEKTLHSLGLCPAKRCACCAVTPPWRRPEGMRIWAGEIGQEACRALAEGIEKRWRKWSPPWGEAWALGRYSSPGGCLSSNG